MVCKKGDSHSPIEEAPVIVPQKNESGLERIPRFVTELADIFLRVVKQERRRITSRLAD